MRTKAEILGETRHHEQKGTVDLIAITTQLRILTEVLIDLRDILSTNAVRVITLLSKALNPKGGDTNDIH